MNPRITYCRSLKNASHANNNENCGLTLIKVIESEIFKSKRNFLDKPAVKNASSKGVMHKR